MGNNESPGKVIRRISKKLYEVAWIKTKESLLKLVQYANNNQQSSVSQGQAITKLTVCSYHVTYAFQSESTLYSCLNVKELLARNRREITLKRVRDMIRTYSQMHRTDKYSQHSSIIWPVWLNG